MLKISSSSNTAIKIILIIGFSVRVLGIFWSIPSDETLMRSYHPDEPKIIEGATEFPEHIRENTDLRYPTFLHYFIGVISSPFRLLNLSDNEYFTWTYVLGRLISLLFGVGSIYLTYRLSLLLYGEKTALISATVLALSWYHVQSSAWATTDVTASFFFIAFLLLSVKSIYHKENWISYSLAGIIFGVLTGTKYPGAIAGIAFLVLYINKAAQEESVSSLFTFIRFLITDKRIYFFIFTAITTFFITTPGLILHPSLALDAILIERARLGQGYTPIYNIQTWMPLFGRLEDAIGLPFSIIVVFGVLRALLVRKKESFEIAGLIIIAIYFIVFGSSLATRYYILLLPLLAILAAKGVIYLLERKEKYIQLLTKAVLFTSIIFSLGYSLLGNFSRLSETRNKASRFILDEIPASTSIGIGYTSEEIDWMTHAYKYPFIDFEIYEYVDFLKYPEILILSSLDSDEIQYALSSGKMDNNFIWPDDNSILWYRAFPPSPEIFLFYDILWELSENKQSQYCLLKAFYGKIWIPIDFPTPDISIYARKDSPISNKCSSY